MIRERMLLRLSEIITESIKIIIGIYKKDIIGTSNNDFFWKILAIQSLHMKLLTIWKSMDKDHISFLNSGNNYLMMSM